MPEGGHGLQKASKSRCALQVASEDLDCLRVRENEKERK